MTSPSCSQKRTLLFAEHLNEEVLLRLPHRQFVFTFPKALRVFFRHDRKLFAKISKMIFAMISDFYREVAGKELRTGMVIAHLRFFAKRKYLALPHIRDYRLSGMYRVVPQRSEERSRQCSGGIPISMQFSSKAALMQRAPFSIFPSQVSRK